MTSELEILSKKISGKFWELLTWQWDDRFNTVLAEFRVDDIQEIFGELKHDFKDSWDFDTIKTAPEHIQLNCNRFGRLFSDQVFSATDSDNNTFIYCAIWPWSDGERVSIRLAPYDKTLSEDEMDELKSQFRSWFDL